MLLLEENKEKQHQNKLKPHNIYISVNVFDCFFSNLQGFTYNWEDSLSLSNEIKQSDDSWIQEIVW